MPDADVAVQGALVPSRLLALSLLLTPGNGSLYSFLELVCPDAFFSAILVNITQPADVTGLKSSVGTLCTDPTGLRGLLL